MTDWTILTASELFIGWIVHRCSCLKEKTESELYMLVFPNGWLVSFWPHLYSEFSEDQFVFRILNLIWSVCPFLAFLKKSETYRHKAWRILKGGSINSSTYDYHWFRYMLILICRCDVWCRKKLFLQTVSEAVVQNIKKLLQVHPMLIIATKSVIFGNRYSTASNDVKVWVL